MCSIYREQLVKKAEREKWAKTKCKRRRRKNEVTWNDFSRTGSDYRRMTNCDWSRNVTFRWDHENVFLIQRSLYALSIVHFQPAHLLFSTAGKLLYVFHIRCLLSSFWDHHLCCSISITAAMTQSLRDCTKAASYLEDINYSFIRLTQMFKCGHYICFWGVFFCLFCGIFL